MTEPQFQPLHAEDAALTASETLIWLGQSHLPDTPLYNVILEFRIEGGVDAELFRQAFAILVQRETSLRTVYREVDGAVQRKILADPPAKLDILPEKRSLIDINSLREDRSQRNFDVRACVYDSWLVHEQETSDAFWTLNVHHLANDSESFCLFQSRLAEIYAALEAGESVPTAPFPAFCQFARIENRLRDPQPDAPLADLAAARFYRPSPSGPASPSLREERPTNAIAAPVQDSGLLKNLEILAQLTTAISAYLYRVEGRENATIGIIVQHRNAPQLRQTAGLFIEILPFELEVDTQISFSALCEQNRRKLRDLIGQSRPGQVTPNSQKRFDIILNLVTGSFVPVAGRPVTSRWLQARQMDPNHRLCLHLHDYDGTGQARLVSDFNLAAFPKSWDRERFWAHFEACLMSAGDGRQGCSDFVIDSAAAELKPAHPARTNTPRLEAAIFQRALDTPDQIALVQGETQLTYRELAERAEGIAQHLHKCGLARGEIVLSHFGRQLEGVIANVGILRAGGIFCPLPPETPPERFNHFVRETKAGHVLSRDWNCDAEITVHQIDDIPGVEITEPSDPITGDEAYALFTSGSTGWPKGVICRHSSVFQLLEDFERRAPLSTECACAWWTAPSFDVSIYEVFSALCFGRTLHIADEATRLDSVAYLDWINRLGIESAYLPGHSLRSVSEKCSLRRLLIGVEAISWETTRDLAAKLPNLRIVNGYGPTEATICATFFDVTAEDHCNTPNVPLGRPLQGTLISLRDRDGNDCPAGVIGEICIRGAGLACGYLRNGKPDAFPDSGYCTGDLGYLDEFGQLHFAGRKDHQLKWRGFRMEPGEIIAAILAQDDLQEAYVDVFEQRLTAFVAPESKSSESELREALGQRLPGYMLPESIVFLPSLPRNGHDKVNRAALETLAQTQNVEEATMPDSELETLLAEIWKEFLPGVDITSQTHFFRAGGDSLGGMQIASQVSRRLGINWPVTAVLQHPILAKQASALETYLEKRTET